MSNERVYTTQDLIDLGEELMNPFLAYDVMAHRELIEALTQSDHSRLEISETLEKVTDERLAVASLHLGKPRSEE